MNALATPSTFPGAMSGPEAGADAPILVVDDSSLFRRLAGGLIRDGVGRDVVYAEDGLEALRILESARPSIVLTDLHMPGMDGLELVGAIRSCHPQVPVILMTAFGSESVAVRALESGAASYVPKDRLASGLVGTVRQVLGVVEGIRRRSYLLSCQTSRRSSYRIGNDPGLFPDLIALIQEELSTFAIGDDNTRTRVAVALQEALANAMYHGNLECSSELRQGDERDFYRLATERRQVEPYRSRRIHLESSVDREEFRVSIRDEGPGFDVSILESPFDPEDLMRIGGRGMILIRSFLDEVIHDGTGNEITLVKRR